MGSAADKVEVVKALELVLRAEVEHLVQGVGEIEGGPDEDVRVFPALWGEDLFFDDVIAEVLHVGLLDHAIDDLLGVSFFFGFPVVTVAGVDGRDEEVELGVSGRSDGGVGDARVPDVDRHVLRNRPALEDLLQVAMVIVPEDDVVVGLVLVEFIDSEIEHESGAGVFFLEEFFAGFLFLTEDRAARVGVVGVDNELVARENLAVDELHFGRCFANILDFPDLGIEADFAALLFHHPGHAFRDFREAALGVVDPVFVFDVGKNAEEPGAFPGGHSEVFRLEGEGEFEAVVVEISAQHVHDRPGGGDMGEGFEKSRGEVGGEIVV